MLRAVLAFMLACGPTVLADAPAGDDATSSAPASTGVAGESTSTSGSTSTGADVDTTSTGAAPADVGDYPPGFILEPDGNSVSIECSVWHQDCPPGEKCMPWANDGGNAWNATRCSPIAPNPDQPGEACTVELSGISGMDTCDIASMCWWVDPATNEGTCVAFCVGSENDPLCIEPFTSCSIGAEGTLILCLPSCDPLLQDCGEMLGCWGIDDDFTCAPDASGDMGVYGDPCEYINVCDPGLFCAEPETVPGCMASGCCSPYCDVDEAEQCPGVGQECVPVFEPGEAAPPWEDVGVCAVPS